MKHIRKQRQGLEFQLCIKPRERFKANKSHEAGSFLLGVAFSFILATTQSFANPEGGRVVAGSATIQQTTAGRLDVLQNSHKAIIDWRGFSIQNGEHTHFQQPNTSSMTLNRVTGGQSSVIHGNLSANGNVFLLNPNGVLFGKNSKVNVGGLIATTSQIDNDDFMAGSFSFDKGSDKLSAAVINRGQIKVTDGGTVVLAASSVSNEGLINARLGQVVLAGTESFTLDFNGDGLLQFNLGEKTQLDSSAKQTENVPVTNSGIVMADGGVVQMTTHVANTVVDHVINMEGVIQARAVDVQGGTIILSGGESGIVAVSGTLDVSGAAPGQTGGVVKVLGDKVGLFDGTEIDASGDAGGGTVLVGGNYQGKGQEPKARRTIVAENTMINADALTDGDGGTVVLWSDEITAFSGEISAKAGLNGGDGGLVEVSGKQELIFRGQVDLNSAHGLNGSLLLDPLNIVISSQPQLNNDNELNDNQILAGDSPGTSFTISEQTVETLSADANIILEATNDITISNLSDDILAFQSTTGSVTFSADADNDGNGTFSLSDIELQTQGGNLTVNAANIVELGNSSEIITNGGDISLISSDLFDMRFLFLDSSSSDVGGNINVEASSNVVLTGRPLNVDSSGSSQGGNVRLASNNGFVDIGDVDAFSTAGIGGQINLNALGDISTGSLTSRGVTAGGDVTLFSATGNIDTDFAIEFPPLNPINTSAASGPGGNVLVNAAGLVSIGDINSFSNQDSGGNVTVFAGGNISLAGISSSSVSGNAGDVSLINSNGNITTAVINTVSAFSDAGSINIEAFGNINTSDLFASAANNDDGGGNTGSSGGINLISIDGNINTGGLFSPSSAMLGSAGNSGAISVNANSGSISILGPVWTFSEALNVSGEGASINLSALDDIVVSSVNPSLFGIVQSASRSEAGTAGNGGVINIRSIAGAVRIDDTVATFSTGLNSSGNGGGVDISAGIVAIGDVDTSSTGGIGGQIDINAQGDISTGTLTSTGVTAGGDVDLISTAGNVDTAFAKEGPPFNPINTFATAGSGGEVVISASGLIEIGGVNTSGSSPSNGGNINFTANEINLSADLVSTGGTLLFQPSSPFQNIVIGGEFDSDLALDITASDLSFITGSFESLTIGRDNGSGRILIDPAGVSFNQTTTLRSPITGGSTVIDGAIQSNGNDLTLIAGSNVDVNANVTTAGGNLDINSGGSIDSIAVINTGSSNETAGAVNIEAAANITVADIQTNSVNGVSNIINISSTGGSIDTTAGKLASFAENAGDAAAITLNAEGDINVADVSASALNGDGGNITLISQNGEINTAELNTISVPANAGDIRVEAQGNINTDNVFASALNNDNNSSETADTGNAGNITLISNNGDIATAGLLAPASAITGSAGDGGVISVSADNGKVSVDGVVWAFSEAENNTGSGGSINFTAKNDIQILSEGSTNFGVVQSSSKSESGTAGNGGDVSFKTSEGGLIIEDDISTVARGLNASGNGGNVDISTAGNVDITTINTSSEGISDGGDVNISAGSALTFDNIVTSNQSVGLSSRTGNGGDVNIFAATDLVLKRINTSAEEALNGGDISVSISSGDLTVDQNVVAGNGNINFSASDNVVFTNDFASLGNISVTADSISLHDVTTNGSQTYTGSVAFNSDYKTGGEDFTVNGPSVLLSPTSINTSGGAITFNGEVNGSNDLTLLAGNSGDILFREDVGVSTPLGLIDIQSANNVNVFGQMFARQLNVVYQGSFTTDPAGFLDVGGLFLSSEAQSASLAGIVNGAAGEDTALLVEGPVGNSNFTINGCVIGVSCNEEPEIPVVVEPRPTPNINADILTESSTTEAPAVVAVAQRSSPSDDPNQYQFSNLGNEELWDNNPGGYSVSSFAAFTVSSPEDREKKDEEKGEE